MKKTPFCSTRILQKASFADEKLRKQWDEGRRASRKNRWRHAIEVIRQRIMVISSGILKITVGNAQYEKLKALKNRLVHKQK